MFVTLGYSKENKYLITKHSEAALKTILGVSSHIISRAMIQLLTPIKRDHFFNLIYSVIYF